MVSRPDGNQPTPEDFTAEVGALLKVLAGKLIAEQIGAWEKGLMQTLDLITKATESYPYMTAADKALARDLVQQLSEVLTRSDPSLGIAGIFPENL